MTERKVLKHWHLRREANGREPKSSSAQVFHFKLGSFANMKKSSGRIERPWLKLKTRTSFCPWLTEASLLNKSLSLTAPLSVTKVIRITGLTLLSDLSPTWVFNNPASESYNLSKFEGCLLLRINSVKWQFFWFLTRFKQKVFFINFFQNICLEKKLLAKISLKLRQDYFYKYFSKLFWFF